MDGWIGTTGGQIIAGWHRLASPRLPHISYWTIYLAAQVGSLIYFVERCAILMAFNNWRRDEEMDDDGGEKGSNWQAAATFETILMLLLLLVVVVFAIANP